MTRSISEALRFRVVAAVDGGLSRCAIAECFGCKRRRWVREWPETGSTRIWADDQPRRWLRWSNFDGNLQGRAKTIRAGTLPKR